MGLYRADSVALSYSNVEAAKLWWIDTFGCKVVRVPQDWDNPLPSDVALNNRSLDLLTEVGTQCERAVIVQLLVTSPAHGIAHALYFNFRSEFQSFPIGDVWKHELCLPNFAG